MNNSTTKFIKELLQSAESAIKVIINAEEILKKKGIQLPSCYQKNRMGVKLNIRIPKYNINITKNIGDIPHKSDDEFHTKAEKYYLFANGKTEATINDGITLSEDSLFILKGKKYKVPGGIKVWHPIYGWIQLSISGRHASVDQLGVCLIAFHHVLATTQRIEEIYKTKSNPFLEWKIFKTLFNAME